MTSKNARGLSNDPTGSSTDPHFGEDSDGSAEQSIARASKGYAGQGAYSEDSARRPQDDVGQSTDLPDSWDDVDVSPPYKLCASVSPGDFERAADVADSVFEVTRDLRLDREVAKKALVRLGLTDVPIAGATPLGHTTGGEE
jgi:hypothetical protein